jgi:hypothetical protein
MVERKQVGLTMGTRRRTGTGVEKARKEGCVFVCLCVCMRLCGHFCNHTHLYCTYAFL